MFSEGSAGGTSSGIAVEVTEMFKEWPILFQENFSNLIAPTSQGFVGQAKSVIYGFDRLTILSEVEGQ